MLNFVSVVQSISQLAHGEKWRTHSLSHSLSQLFDVPGTEAFASERTLYFQAASAGVS